MEESFRGRHGEERVHFSAAAGLAEDGDVAGVAAEAADIVAHPFERENDVHHADVAGVSKFFAVLREIEMADGAEAMIERDEDDVAGAREAFAVVGGMLLPVAGDESAAVKPDHDGTLCVVVDARRPDVEAKTVFVLDAVVPVKQPGVFVVGPAAARGLRRDPAVLHRAANAGPWLGLCGSHETRGAFGAGAVGNSLEGVNADVRVAADFAGGGFDDVGFVGGDDGGAFCRASVGRRSCVYFFGGEEVRGGGAGEDRCGLDQGAASELGHVVVPFFAVRTFSRSRVGAEARWRGECITSTDVGARLVSSGLRRGRRGPGRGGDVRGRG